MPGDLAMYWDITSVMVEVGGTATATYTGSQPSKEQLDTLLDGKATVEVSSGVVTFTGVSAGEVTIPSYSFVSSSVYSGNAITVSVTDPTEDESYLNKRGLAHFWNNIDTLKQDKITAGNYSTSEQDTKFTWVDGSTIYKKTVYIADMGTGSTVITPHGVSNLSKIIKFEGVLTAPSGQFWPVPSFYQDANNGRAMIRADANNLYTNNSPNLTNISSAYITIWYTKTS